MGLGSSLMRASIATDRASLSAVCTLLNSDARSSLKRWKPMCALYLNYLSQSDPGQISRR